MAGQIGSLFLVVVRSLLAVVIGLLLISLITELIEFGVVTALHGAVTTDQAIYFEIRNRLPVILFKFVYNGVAALIGGFVAGWIAGRKEIHHGVALALAQALALLWAMTVSPYAQTTPLWVWLVLLVEMTVGIVGGAWFHYQRKGKQQAVT